MLIKYLSEGAKMTVSTVFWLQGKDQHVQSHMVHLSETDRAFYAWVPKDFDTTGFIQDLKDSGHQECLFSTSLTSANLFFKARFLGHDSTGLKFAVPDKVYKVQRRKNVRYMIPAGYVLKVEFSDPLYPDMLVQKKLTDISAGGLAFNTAAIDVSLYPVGSILTQCKIVIKTRNIQFDAEVRYAQAHQDTSKGAKIGLAFKNMLPPDSEFIAAYVFEESRKYFARFL